MPTVPKGTSPQKDRRKTSKRLNPLTLILLTYLLAITNNLLPTKAKLTRKIKIISKEVFGTKETKKVVVTTFLQRLLIPISSKKKQKISHELKTFTITGRDILLFVVFKKGYKN